MRRGSVQSIKFGKSLGGFPVKVKLGHWQRMKDDKRRTRYMTSMKHQRVPSLKADMSMMVNDRLRVMGGGPSARRRGARDQVSSKEMRLKNSLGGFGCSPCRECRGVWG